MASASAVACSSTASIVPDTGSPMKPKPVPPGPGQESVWDYPRPPRLEAVAEQVEVVFAGRSIAFTDAPLRVLETSHPPVYYVPPDSVEAGVLEPNGAHVVLRVQGRRPLLRPGGGRQALEGRGLDLRRARPRLRGHGRLRRLLPGPDGVRLLDGEAVQAQPGGFYGGWITTSVVGPFKGLAGTLDW